MITGSGFFLWSYRILFLWSTSAVPFESRVSNWFCMLHFLQPAVGCGDCFFVANGGPLCHTALVRINIRRYQNLD